MAKENFGKKKKEKERRKKKEENERNNYANLIQEKKREIRSRGKTSAIKG